MSLVLLFLSLIAPVFGQQLTYKVHGRAVWAIQPRGTTEVRTHLGKATLDISIHAWQAPAHPDPSPTAGSYPGCVDPGRPCSITDWIHIRLGAKTLDLDPSKIANLTDMHYVAVAGSPARLILILIGDDAAESYEAHFIFNRRRVVERVLYGLDLYHPYEVSHFYSIEIGSPGVTPPAGRSRPAGAAPSRRQPEPSPVSPH